MIWACLRTCRLIGCYRSRLDVREVESTKAGCVWRQTCFITSCIETISNSDGVFFCSSYNVNKTGRGMSTDAVFYSLPTWSLSTWIHAVNYQEVFVAVLVGNSRGPYTQLPPALNAAIVLFCKMKGFVCLCGCVGGSAYDYLYKLDPRHSRPGPRPSVLASRALCLVSQAQTFFFLSFCLFISLSFSFFVSLFSRFLIFSSLTAI